MSNNYSAVFIDGQKRSLKVSEESVKWITPAKTVRAFASILRNYVPAYRPFTILDMTANHGADTIGFASLLKNANVTSVELDPMIYNNLQYNIKKYPELLRRIDFRNGNSTDFLTSYFDLIYIDPPFNGNLYYHSNKKYMLGLESSDGKFMSLQDIVEETKAPLIMLKTPTDDNFDNASLKNFLEHKEYNFEYLSYVDLRDYYDKEHKTNCYIIEKPYQTTSEIDLAVTGT